MTEEPFQESLALKYLFICSIDNITGLTVGEFKAAMGSNLLVELSVVKFLKTN